MGEYATTILKAENSKRRGPLNSDEVRAPTNPHPALFSLIRLCLNSCITALMATFIYGCKVGFIESVSPLLMSSRSPFPATRNEISWMASISHTGSLVSVILCYMLTNKVSSRIFIMGSLMIFILCWLLILLTSTIKVVIGCMFCYGMAASILSPMAHIYFSEITTPGNRELLILLYPLGTALGIQFENLIAGYESYKLLAAFPFALGILVLTLYAFMVESPYYLVSKGKHEEACNSLRWLQDRAADDSMTAELAEIENYVKEQRGIVASDFKAIFLPGNLKLLGALVLIGIPGTINCNTIVYIYGSVIIQGLEAYVDGKVFTNICCMIRTMCTVLGILAVKRFRRRILIVYGMMCIAVIELSCSFCFHLEREAGYEWELGALMIACLIFLFMLVAGTTVSPAFAVLKPEVLPHRLKEFYLSFLGFKSDLLSFLVIKSYFWLSDTLGMDYLLLAYSSFYLLGIPCAYFFIRDTKGKSLNQIRIDYASTMGGKK